MKISELNAFEAESVSGGSLVNCTCKVKVGDDIKVTKFESEYFFMASFDHSECAIRCCGEIAKEFQMAIYEGDLAMPSKGSCIGTA